MKLFSIGGKRVYREERVKMGIRNNSKNRVLAMLVSVFMLISLMPINAMTAEDTENVIDETGIANNKGLDISSPLTTGEVRTGKTVVNNGDGTFDITLEAIARKFATEQTERPNQYDVVFVLDYSTSMNADNKLNRMITAAATAVNQILQNNTATAQNRVAVVSYGT